MNAYQFTLFLHFIFLTAAVVGAALAGYAALHRRSSETAADALWWGAFVRRVVRIFPLASVGLIVTGGYMTHRAWSWSTPWISAGLAGLIVIMLLGAGVEGARDRTASAELRAAGLSQRARRLLRDPIAWSARVTTWTLVVAVIFVMTVKPSATICIASFAVALVCGVVGAVPFWATAPGGAVASAASREGDLA